MGDKRIFTGTIVFQEDLLIKIRIRACHPCIIFGDAQRDQPSPEMGNQASKIPPCLLINSSFTAPRLGHSILWEMRKDGQKEAALIIIHSSIRYVL
jgi:hypothetical protein